MRPQDQEYPSLTSFIGREEYSQEEMKLDLEESIQGGNIERELLIKRLKDGHGYLSSEK